MPGRKKGGTDLACAPPGTGRAKAGCGGRPADSPPESVRILPRAPNSPPAIPTTTHATPTISTASAHGFSSSATACRGTVGCCVVGAGGSWAAAGAVTRASAATSAPTNGRTIGCFMNTRECRRASRSLPRAQGFVRQHGSTDGTEQFDDSRSPKSRRGRPRRHLGPPSRQQHEHWGRRAWASRVLSRHAGAHGSSGGVPPAIRVVASNSSRPSQSTSSTCSARTALATRSCSGGQNPARQ